MDESSSGVIGGGLMLVSIFTGECTVTRLALGFGFLCTEDRFNNLYNQQFMV